MENEMTEKEFKVLRNLIISRIEEAISKNDFEEAKKILKELKKILED